MKSIGIDHSLNLDPKSLVGLISIVVGHDILPLDNGSFQGSDACDEAYVFDSMNAQIRN